MTRSNKNKAREEFVALGNIGYSNAINAMMDTIGDLIRSIKVWDNVLGRLGEPVEGEDSSFTESRKDHLYLVA